MEEVYYVFVAEFENVESEEGLTFIRHIFVAYNPLKGTVTDDIDLWQVALSAALKVSDDDTPFILRKLMLMVGSGILVKNDPT